LKQLPREALRSGGAQPDLLRQSGAFIGRGAQGQPQLGKPATA